MFFGIDSDPHFFLSTDVYAGQPLDALSSIMPISLGGRSVVTESILNIFCPCAIMSAVSGYWHGTYRSLLCSWLSVVTALHFIIMHIILSSEFTFR